MTRAPFDHEKNTHIMNNPKYMALTHARHSFAIMLSAIILIMYFGFILLIAFDKDFLGQPLFDGSTTTLGMPVGVLIIVVSIVLTGIYVRKANSEFDDLNRQIMEEAHK